jgi:hypothetical protein
MKEKLLEGTRLKEQINNENKALKTELDACRKVINSTSTENMRETSTVREREPPRSISEQVLLSLGDRRANNTSMKNKRQLLPSLGGTTKLYSDVVAEHDEKKFEIIVRTKGTHTPEEIKSLLKEKVKLTEIKVGIQSLKPLRDGRVIIEVGSRKEMESLEEGIRERCGEELETNIQKLRKPSLVILNIPSEITMENIKETLTQQNTEI